MRISCLLAMLACLPAAAFAQTQTQSAAPDPSAKPACIDIEVNGERVRDYDCLGEMLASPAAQVSRPPQLTTSEEIARRPSNSLGLFNREATSQRMGNTFGKSVLPQRPATPPPVSPVIPRRP